MYEYTNILLDFDACLRCFAIDCLCRGLALIRGVDILLDLAATAMALLAVTRTVEGPGKNRLRGPCRWAWMGEEGQPQEKATAPQASLFAG